MDFLLEVRRLKKVYKDGTEALKGIDLSVKKGEFVAIIGPSGAGKSTLLRCINLLVKPTEGEVYFNGYNILKASKKELRNIRREIGMIFQNFNLIPRTTVIDNVLNGRLGYVGTLRSCCGLFSKKDKEFAFELLERVGLSDKALKKVEELSGGQQQRVAIARALAQTPKLILADEPVASLDPVTADNIMEYMFDICKKDNIAFVVNLHQVEFAKKYADRIIGIKKGIKIFDNVQYFLSEDIINNIYENEEKSKISISNTTQMDMKVFTSEITY
ncbi:phosphonate ABC transporter ATP-binding protein [Caldicellulosiruptor morganii]|uniref:Phosphonate ABC transporter ATP-binding protein n=1 Tax=Caldicellulosiruptor morganii TaxID=1387555 RepID=A0ABY7BPM6_9FIRM|nr:phosphonate ABC transporter ATP-binding protein [Caldicellulosiruptor morganii]WAM33486.1 phosphonate ABC transporter ATP-binding protein [Caldicellulosiruptor morganii]